MPLLNGYEAAQQIRALKCTTNGKVDYDHVPIVAVTAAATEEDQRQCFESGMNYFLSKPVTLNALQEILAQVKLEPGLRVYDN